MKNYYIAPVEKHDTSREMERTMLNENSLAAAQNYGL